MKGRTGLGCLLLVAALMSARPVLAQSDKAPAQDADMAAMMQEFHKWADPGAMHKHLEKLAGRWTVAMKMTMDPNAPPVESKGACSSAFVIGGRWLRQEFKGEMMGMPYEGIGMIGYDNFRQEYVCTWADNTTTAMLRLTGTCNEAGTEFTLSGTMDQPMTGERDKKFRHVWKFTGADTYTMEMYDTIPGKGEVMVMTLEFTRVK